MIGSREVEFGNENSMKRLIASASMLASKRLSWLIDGALLVLMALAILQAAHAFLAPSFKATAEGSQSVIVAQKKSNADMTDIDALFFSDLSASRASNAPAAESGNIKLFGTRPSGKGMGTAIVAANNQPQAVFKSGAEIANGIFLTAVYGDRIEISRNGKLNSVYMDGSQAGRKRRLIQTDGTPSAAAPIAAQKTAAAPQKAAKPISFFKPPSMRTKSPRPTQRASRRGAGGPNVLQTLGLSQSANGLTIGPRASSVALTAAGLKYGDIITSINGNSVNDKRAMSQLFSLVQRGSGMTLTVLRDGQEQTVSVNANALRLAQMGQ